MTMTMSTRMIQLAALRDSDTEREEQALSEAMAANLPLSWNADGIGPSFCEGYHTITLYLGNFRVGLLRVGYDKDQRVELASISIHPRVRRQGHGSTALKRLCDAVQVLGYREIYGHVSFEDWHNIESLTSFYENNGFVVVAYPDRMYATLLKTL